MKPTSRTRGRPATGQRPDVRVFVEQETFERMKTEADAEFCPIATLASIKLEEAFSSDAPAAKPKSGLAAQRQREKEIDIELKELKLAKERRETLTVCQVLEFYEKEITVIRSRLIAVPHQIVGATPELVKELKKTIADAMADIRGDTKEAWENVQAES
jgi:hypothetical protein